MIKVQLVKIQIVIFLCFSIQMIGVGQIFEYGLSEELGLDPDYSFGKYLVKKGDRHYFFFEKERSISLVSCNKQFKDIFIDEIKTESRDVEHVDVLYSNEGFGWITYRNNFRKKQFEYELTPISLQGNFSRIKKIVNLRYKSERRIPKTTIQYSQDSSKILMVFEIDFDRTDDYAAYIFVMDYDFNPLWQYDYEPKINQRKFDVFSWDISNSGDVYMVNKVYDGNDRDEDKKRKGKQLPAYEIIAHKFTQVEKYEKVIEKDGEFIKLATLKCNQNSDVFLVYGFGYRKEDPIEGFSFSRIEGTNFDNWNTNDFLFDERSLEGFSKYDILKNSRGIGLLPGYEFKDIVFQENGEAQVLLYNSTVRIDRFNSFNSFNSPYGMNNNMRQDRITYIDLSFIVFTLDSAANYKKFNLIPRRFDSDQEYATGINMFANGNELLLFYNDDRSNLKGNISDENRRDNDGRNQFSYFVATTIFPDKVYDRSGLVSFNELGGIINTATISKLAKNKYFFVLNGRGWSPDNYKVGVLDLDAGVE